MQKQYFLDGLMLLERNMQMAEHDTSGHYFAVAKLTVKSLINKMLINSSSMIRHSDALELAFEYIGLTEKVGLDHNPEIVSFFHEIGYSWVLDDETPWCLHGDIEILTENGFLKFKEAVKTDLSIAQLNTENHKIEFVKDYLWVEKQHSDNVYSINKSSINLICDKTHEFYGKISSSSKYQKKKINEITSYGIAIPTISIDKEDNELITDHELLLLAAFLSDGHKKFNRINIGVSKSHKINILDKMSPKWTKWDNKEYEGKKKRKLYSFLYPEIYHEILTEYKLMKWEFIMSLSSRQARYFIESYSNFDGTRVGSSFELFTQDKLLRDQLNYLATIAGYKSTPYDSKQVSKNTKIEYLYCVYVSSNKHKYLMKKDLKEIEFNDKLYCATVPSGVIIIRDFKGNIFPIGNCAAFAGFILKKSGYKHSGKLNARSYLTVGERVEVPELGDIVVFFRGDPVGDTGHVAFYLGESKNNIYCLGGNQSNKVQVSAYDKAHVLGFRRLSKV